MKPRGNTLKLTAVSALVVLTLTGFSTGRHGGSHGHGGGGGGCSSSSQNHDSSTSGGGSHRDDDYDSDSDYDSDYDYDGDTGYDDSYDDTDTSGGSGADSGSSSGLEEGTVKLVRCATKASPYATVEVTNPNAANATFSVTIAFRDGKGNLVSTSTRTVEVPGADSATAQVAVSGSAAKVARCDVEPKAPALR
ncbi:hypothetical protein [Streptomyces thermospinosisporus]